MSQLSLIFRRRRKNTLRRKNMQRTCISLLCGQSRLAMYNSLPSSVGGNILRGRGGQILCKTILIHKTYSKEQQKGWGRQEEYEKRKWKIWQQLQQVRGPNFSPFFSKSVHFDAGDHKAGGPPLTRGTKNK